MADTYLKYGRPWFSDTHPLEVEMYYIRKGKEYCEAQGRSLAFHFEQFRKICWPKLDDHRWHRLCLEEITKNKVTVLMGPGSSGKTHEAAWTYLVEYWCHPDETCVLVSSTDIRGLRKRVWGEITDLWQQGVDKFDFLAGHLLDSALAITTDSLEDVEFGERKVRDMRVGCFGIPCIQGGKFVGLSKFVGIKQKRMRLIADEACFPFGTLVDTPNGKLPIESIKIGDTVLNCLGEGKVTGTSRKRSTRLVHIQTADGRELICTPTHPVLTRQGWKNALHVNQSDVMVESHEAMRIVRRAISAAGNKLGSLRSLSGERKDGCLRSMRRRSSQEVPQSEEEFLQSLLLVEASAYRPGISKEVLHQEAVEKNFIYQKEERARKPRSVSGDEKEDGRGYGKIHGISAGGGKAKATQVYERPPKKNWAQAENTRGAMELE